MVGDQIKGKNLTLKVDMQRRNVIVKGDRERLCQVMLNLLSNSIRFTERGGITISIK